MLTYGDGVADINLDRLLEFHIAHGKTATLTSVDVRQRFGVLTVNKEGGIIAFGEKCEKHRERINGGFMVLEPEIFSYLSDDSTVFEKEPMRRLAQEGKLMSYYHTGFWKCMDTQRDKKELEDLWSRQSPPWKLWK